MNFIFILLLFMTSHAFGAGRDICDLLDLKNCSGVSKQGRRSSALSLPSPSTSVLINPANTSFDRGFGIEAIHQSGNPVLFNVATGTGKVGAALISTSMENTFFGNRVKETDEDFFRRKKNKKQYRTKKVSLAVAGKIFRKKNYALDAGLILKRHSEIKRINPGAGLSGRIGPVTFGSSVYQDDFYLKSTGNQERFNVVTYTVGTKIKNFSLDYGVMSTKYDQDASDTRITLTSASYIAGDFLFNLALRNENSPSPKFVDGELRQQDN